MNYYSGKQPNIIPNRVKTSIDKIIEVNDINGTTISEKVMEFVSNIYNNYIAEYKLVVFVLLALVIFLIYRYYNRKENYATLSDLDVHMGTQKLMYNEQPHFNPLYSTELQQKDPKNKVYYPPEKLPVLIDGKIHYTRDLYPPNRLKPETKFINTDDYNYNNVYDHNSRSYYTGTYNTYQHPHDTDIENPPGYPHHFNTDTANFIGPATEANRMNVQEYENIIQKMNDDFNIYKKSDILDNYQIQIPYAN